MDRITAIVTVLCAFIAVFAGNGVWNYLLNKSNPNNYIMEKLDVVTNKLTEIENKVDMNEAVACRTRILRFNNELIKLDKHTFEEYSTILEDIDNYERYCKSHPDFKNNKADLSIRNVKKCFEKCEVDGDFL